MTRVVPPEKHAEREQSDAVALDRRCRRRRAAGAGRDDDRTMSSWVSHHQPANVLRGLGPEVEKTTGGEATMLPKHPSAPSGTFDAVRNGLVDLFVVTTSYTPARHILPLMPELAGSGTARINSVAYSRHLLEALPQGRPVQGREAAGCLHTRPGRDVHQEAGGVHRGCAGIEDPDRRRRGRGSGRGAGRPAFVKPAPNLRAAQLRGGRRCPSDGKDHHLQARHRAGAGHTLPWRHVQLGVRFLHQRGQVEQAGQAGSEGDRELSGSTSRGWPGTRGTRRTGRGWTR